MGLASTLDQVTGTDGQVMSHQCPVKALLQFGSLRLQYHAPHPLPIRMTWTALPITLAGLFWPWGPLGIS